jgi:GTP-binding protein EngB required for normal cell division
MRALRPLIADLGLAEDPTWRAAFAAASGDPQGALRALADDAARGDPAVIERYVRAAHEAKSVEHLQLAVGCAQKSGIPIDSEPATLARVLAAEDPAERVRRLDAAPHSEWGHALRRDALRSWLLSGRVARWAELLAELSRLCRTFGALEALRELEAIAVDLERPLRVAVLGEFNAGKSSFINALLGEAVAPTGILPTTATVNRLVWAPDRFARIETKPEARRPDRVVLHGALAETLKQLDPGSIAQVTIYAPLELLRRIELIDTPGFNALDERHADVARRALAEAHALIWLFDATQPLKDTEQQILTELAARQLPLIALVNKLDRLAEPDGLAAMLEYLQKGLARSAIELEAPPLPFSARLALLGRHGDERALERSRWSDVEALIERVLMAGSDALRESALRRRACGVSERLARFAEEQDRARSARARSLALEAARFQEAAARLRSRRRELEEALQAGLEQALAELERDLQPIRGYEGDPAAQRFIQSRTRELVAPALTERLLSECDVPATAKARVGGQLDAAVAAAVSALSPWLRGPAPWRGMSPGEPLVGAANQILAHRTLVALCADALVEALAGATTAPPVSESNTEEARARALAEAFQSG